MPSLTAMTAIANLIAAGAGLVATNPLNGRPVPTTPRFDLSGASGYAFEIKDAQGDALGKLISRDPVAVDLSSLSTDFINAVIATEDERFFDHDGLDLRGLVAASLDTLRGDMRGGSGIAQQMIKNSLLGPDRTLGRKAAEAMLAVRMQTQEGRRGVLRDYLSSAWMGRGLRGVALAPQTWFGTSWDKMTLAQSATLAAMLKGPGYYDPYTYPDRVKARRDMILDKLAEHGWAKQADVIAAKAEPVTAIAPPARPKISDQVVSALRGEIARLPKSAPRSGTLSLTIDPRWQDIAAASLKARIDRIGAAAPVLQLSHDALDTLSQDKALPRKYWLALPASSSYRTIALLAKTGDTWSILGPKGREDGVMLTPDIKGWHPLPGQILAAGPTANGAIDIHPGSAVQGAVTLIDPRTGAILASVGAADTGLNAFDRSRALRQPGSSVKPFLYLAALEDGMTPQSPIDDTVRTYMSNGVPWTPRNYENETFGILPMHTALERSSNTAAAWIASRVGIDAMAHYAEAAGAYPPGGVQMVLPSALGASESTLTDMTSGYGTLVNDGIARKPHLISTIQEEGKPLYYTHSSTGVGPIASSQSLRALLGMMRGVVTRGTASSAFKTAPVLMAGKTGTSQDWRDAWFIGVTPQLAAGAWVGRDNSTSLPNHLAGGTAAAPIIVDIVTRAKAAGLIDDQGMRDKMMSSGTAWPPEIPQNLPVRSKPASPAARDASPGGVGEGSFWGVVSDQRDGDYTKSPPDRNADIIKRAW